MENTTYTETDRAPFVITDEGGANWLLSKLANLDAEADRIKANTEKRVQELQTDRAALLHQFGGQLEAFARTEADRRRRKTITLANGVVSFRALPARLTVADTDRATDTARTFCPEAVCIETVERLDRAALVKAATAHMEATGEVLPGLDLIPASESVSITTVTGYRERSKPGAKE